MGHMEPPDALAKATISLARWEGLALNSTFWPSPSAQTILNMSLSAIRYAFPIWSRQLPPSLCKFPAFQSAPVRDGLQWNLWYLRQGLPDKQGDGLTFSLLDRPVAPLTCGPALCRLPVYCPGYPGLFLSRTQPPSPSRNRPQSLNRFEP